MQLLKKNTTLHYIELLNFCGLLQQVIVAHKKGFQFNNLTNYNHLILIETKI